MNITKKFGVFLYDRFSGRNAKKFEVHDKIFTWANLLTFSGMFAVGLYVYQFTSGTLQSFIPITKIYIATTDIFDGWIADHVDKFHSTWGKAIDPWRDRMDAFAVLLNVWWLYGHGILPAVFLIVLPEGIILAEGFWLYLSKKEIAEVHWVGKFRMAVHQVCAFAILVQAYWFGHFYVNVSVLLGCMALASFGALLSYNFFHREEIVRALFH